MVEHVGGKVRLDIGCGLTPQEGYIGIDRRFGGEAYPLQFNDGTPVPDNSVDEILASHVLEHFGHHEALAVLQDWVRVLKPGGRLRVAVPNFTHIAREHLKDTDSRYWLHLLGGQTDQNDFHHSAYDRHVLGEFLRQAGLSRIRMWEGVKLTCSDLPVSLNLEGYKGRALTARHPLPKVAAVLSMPRLAFTDNMACALTVCGLGIPFFPATGAYWDQCLERTITDLLDDRPDLQYVLTMDYDSLFREPDVLTMCDLMHEHPEADALAAVQVRRSDGNVMVMIVQEDGTPFPEETKVHKDYFRNDVTRAWTAHFGLTLFRADKLRSLAHPWFQAVPNKEGRWEHGRRDADINFWHYWKESGRTLYLANRVPIGHAELTVSWPKEGGGTTHQSMNDFRQDKEPTDLWQ